jgi:hypothetical protein
VPRRPLHGGCGVSTLEWVETGGGGGGLTGNDGVSSDGICSAEWAEDAGDEKRDVEGNIKIL